MQVQRPQLYQPGRKKGLDVSLSVLRFFLFLLLVCVSVVSALPSLVVGLFLWLWQVKAYDRREVKRGLIAASIFGALMYGLWCVFANPLPWLWGSITFDLARHLWSAGEHLIGLLWAFNLWLAPFCGLALYSFSPFRQLPRHGVGKVKSVSLFAYEHDEDVLVTSALSQFEGMLATEQSQATLERAVSSAPVVAPAAIPTSPARYEALGVYQGGELDQWVFSSELCIPPDLLELHGLLIGEPKMGKTWTLIRLAAIAQAYGRKVMYLDMKGSRKTAALFLAAMSLLKVGRVKVYPLEAYDGWRGTPKALYNRLMQQIDPKTNHPFYRGGVASTIVALAVNAPQGMPKNSYAFLERLNYDWLTAAYPTDAQAMREIEAAQPHIDGVQLVFAGFFRGIAGGLDGSWAFEDTDACYIGVDSVVHKEEAALLGRYLLDDAADYATARKHPGEEVLLIIDEFGGLRSTNATDLYEKVREAGMSIYASSQSYQGLGTERDHVLGASYVKIMHRTGDPRAIVEYAGERDKYAYSRMTGGGVDDEDLLHPLANRVQSDPAQGHQTIMRPEKELAVRVEDVQQLALGQVAVISGGKGGFAQVHPLAIPDVLVRAAASFIASTPKFTPLPPPTRVPGAGGHKKKIAASPPKPKGGQQGKPKGPAIPQPPAHSGKPAFPQNSNVQGVQPAFQGPQPLPATPSTTGGLGQAGTKKMGDEDDDLIDFNN
jgi:hypothetical protein